MTCGSSYTKFRTLPGRGLTDPNKSLMAIAVETIPASPRQGEGIKKSRFVAGSARIAVLPAATAAHLGDFVRGAAKPGARIITDGLKSYDALADSFRHYSIVQGGKNADTVQPVVHILFSNVKTWLNGTFHGVSAKHLPRYAREWNYRFNRRRRITDLTDFLTEAPNKAFLTGVTSGNLVIRLEQVGLR